jgi:predicted HTH domain antitoxin
MPEGRLAGELLRELAAALYADGLLAFGKARELAAMGKYEFGRMLAARGIPRHYTREDLQDDLDYAGRRSPALLNRTPARASQCFAE